MGTLSRLPSDIIREFLGYVSVDSSLSSLALVSSSWLLSARGLDPKFSCVHLRSNNISKFLQLLHSPFCSFLQHVRRLYIDWSLETIPPCAQEIIFNIFNNPSTRPELPNRNSNSKSILLKVKESMLNIRPLSARECHVLNVVCLFPNLEHLQVQLMGIKSNIPIFDFQPRTSTSLRSLSVICNSIPPKQPGTMPQEWKHFLKWIRSNDICSVRSLYLTCMGSWNYEGAEALVKIQGTSLKHLHLGPQRSASQYADLPPPPKILDLCTSLNSLHLEIINTGMSQIAADTISTIPPKSIILLGLDIQHALIRDAAELDNLKRLARALKNRGFTRLRGIRVRLEYDLPRYSFKEAVKILRDVFSKKLLKVESLPYERRHLVRDVTDDCYWPAT